MRKDVYVHVSLFLLRDSTRSDSDHEENDNEFKRVDILEYGPFDCLLNLEFSRL